MTLERPAREFAEVNFNCIFVLREGEIKIRNFQPKCVN